MNNSVLPQNSVIRTALGRNVTKKNISRWIPPQKTIKNAPNWTNALFGWMKNLKPKTNNNSSTISGPSPPESVYNSNSSSVDSNISINSVLSPLELDPKRTNNLINEQLQLGTLPMPTISLNSIKDTNVKDWLKSHPGYWKEIIEAWNAEKTIRGLNANATLPPSFVTEVVTGLMKVVRGGAKSRKACMAKSRKCRTHRKSRRSNRK
jgi:hypothetical protein